LRYWLIIGVAGCKGCAGIHDVTFEPAGIPGSGTVRFESRRDGEAFVRFGTSEDHLDQESPHVDAAKGAVEVRGLRLGTHYYAELVIADGEKERISDGFDFTVGAPPRGIPTLSRNVWSPAESCLDGGYVMFNYISDGTSGVAIADRDAQYVWAIAVDEPLQIGRPRPSRDGRSVLYNVADEGKAEDLAAIYRQPYLGGAPTVTDTDWGHHDFVELPDGDMAWLAYDIRAGQRFPDGTRGTDPLYPEGTTGCIAADTLMRGPEGMTEDDVPTTVWNTWDDYAPGIYTFDDDADVFLSHFVCDDGSAPKEFQHGNSLGFIDAEDVFFVNWRWLDTMVKIEASGELAWQWGGPFNDLVPVGPAGAGATGRDALLGGWISRLDDRSALAEASNVFAVEASFEDDGTYTLSRLNPTELGCPAPCYVHTYGTWTADTSGSPGTLALDQTAPDAATFEGIWGVDGDGFLTLEVVQTTPASGLTPPTREDGFGSTGGSAAPGDNVAVFRRPMPEHAHFSDVWADPETGGEQVLMYDNRNTGLGSRLVRYRLTDATNTQEHVLYEGAYDTILGDFRRMPIEGCENYLVSLSKQGLLQEVSPDGDVVWEVGTGLFHPSGRAYFVPDLYDLSGLAYPE
jgi:hypothetical protein